MFFGDDDDDDGAALLAVTMKARVDAEADPGTVNVLRKAAVAVEARAACIIASRGAWARRRGVWSVWRTSDITPGAALKKKCAYIIRDILSQNS